MDNVCHTLTGAALGEAGLKRRTRFGSAALMIAANLPDVDVLAFLADTPSVALRRGWTHGVLAQAVLPVLLTAGFVAFDRWRPTHDPAAPRVAPAAMLLLAYAGVLSHVAMDWLNTYGVRLLMPLSPQWFYGDAVFIIDPWLWGALAIGILRGRRRRRARPARVALLAASIYILLMIASSAGARAGVAGAWTAASGRAPDRLMVGPVPVNPFGKSVIVDAGDHYQTGTFSWLGPGVRFDPRRVSKNDRHPAAIRAARDVPEFHAVLIWSRFPYYEITPVQGGTRVTLADLRFGRRAVFTVTTLVPDS